MKKQFKTTAAFPEPNYTQIPNDFFKMLPEMESSEVRVTLVMMRQTFGFHRDEFKMGLDELAEAAGLSRNAAKDGAEAAEARGTFRRSNPDKQTKAEWELIIDGQSLPVTECMAEGQPVTSKGSTSDSQVRVKESIKENKETSFFTAEENAQNEAKMKAILEAERQAQEAQDAGKAWRGRELLAPEHLIYGDWWHAKTGLHMYGAKSKAKLDTGWAKAFKELYENDVTTAALDEAYTANEWRTVSTPAQIVSDAKAMQAAPVKVQDTNSRPEGVSSGYYA